MSAIRLETKGPLVTLRLDKPRGNAIDEPLVKELVEVCRQGGADDAVRGVLLASAHPKLFCPGLDLVTLLDYDRAAMGRFLGLFAEALWSLYGLRKPVVAALSGHAVAGGCILALTADFRVLRRGGVQIGLNEVKVGVPLPWSVAVFMAVVWLLPFNTIQLTASLPVVDPATGTAGFGPEVGEGSVALYNDLDDFNGVSLTPPIDIHRTALANFSNFTQQVQIRNVAANNFNTVVANHSTNFYRVTVTVTMNGSPLSTATWIRAR